MTVINRKPASVLALPTPLARLYGVAMEAGIEVHDYPGELHDEDAAIVAVGSVIAMATDLADDGQRPDVLAMALEVAAVMTNDENDPAGLHAPGGFVVITRHRAPGPVGGVGAIATRIARRCGRDTASAAFEWYVPEFAGEDQELLASA